MSPEQVRDQIALIGSTVVESLKNIWLSPGRSGP
jgi:hypothetical protein